MLSNTRALELLLQKRREEETIKISRMLLQQRQYGGYGVPQIPALRTDLQNALSLALLRQGCRQQPLPQTPVPSALPSTHEFARSPSPTATITRSTAVASPLTDSEESQNGSHEEKESHPTMDDVNSKDTDDTFFSKKCGSRETIARSEAFPFKIYRMLHEAHKNGDDHIVSWSRNGESFIIHNIDSFVEILMPRYFTSHRYVHYSFGF
jgi:hypothetical protein